MTVTIVTSCDNYRPILPLTLFLNYHLDGMSEQIFFRSQTLVRHVDNATFSTTAVQCYKTVTEQFHAPYCDDDIIHHTAVRKISEALEIPEDSVTLFEVGDYRVLRVRRGESDSSPYKNLTLIIQEVLQFYLDLQKPIVSIEQIFYPIAFFGPFRMVIDRNKESTNLATVRMYSQFGTLCGKLVNVRVADKDQAVEAEERSHIEQQPMDCSPTPEKRTLSKEKPLGDSPTIRCMEKIGIDCSNIDRRETFTSMGLDSLKTAELEMAIQAEYPSYSIPTGTLFSHPTVAEMDAYLLSCACDVKNKDSTTYSGYLPLSPQQRRLLFMCELDPESSAQFNEPVVFSMRSELFDQSRFVSALNLLVMRHSILRTLYFGDSQVLASGTEVFIATRTSHTDPEKFVALPINVKRTSLHFAVSYSTDRVVVCLVFHHIAVDGYSISIITEEIKALYAGTKLAPPDGQYKDYAEKTSKLHYREELSKWKEKLNNREFQLLPTDRPRTAKQTFNGSSVHKQLPQHLLESLKKLRNIGDCTDFCILTAVYKFLIFKTTGIADFPVGFPSSLREKEFLKTVGCFVNTVPLLETVDTSLTISEYLANFAKAISESRAIDVPLDVLVSTLKLERDDEVTPLFQLLLVMDNVDVPPADSDIAFIDLPTRFSKYEQIWYFQRSGKSLSIKVEYNCDLFLKETIVDLLDRFLYVLDQLGRSAPGQPLKALSITTDSELNFLRRRNAANVCDVPFVTVLQMFQNNLSTQSSIHFGGQEMTYEELDIKSTQLAHQISNTYCANYGELPSRDRCGAVFMERGFDLLAVVLSIWKCGLEVVPLSLDWPVQRIMGMLEVFENPVLVDLSFEELRKAANAKRYPVVHEISEGTNFGKFRNVMEISDLAYITCTSGTTGKPKAVCTEFSGHCNLAPAYTKQFNISNTSCTYQVVNYGFDIFFADLSKTFANGASMTLATELIPKIEEMQGVTNAYIMPAYLSSLPSTDIERLNILESIQFGGEAIQASALELLLQTGIHLYQEHGVTEQTVYTTANKMRVRTPISEEGKPYRNLHLLVRDPDGQLLPEKYQGMLHVNGLGITRGYYSMPALNARTISYGCFGKEFRTGDIVRYHRGRPHFTGRADLQVKIRGRIVDLTEIQNHITTHVDVAACTIAVNEDTGVKELVAYVVPSNGAVSADDLTTFLRQRLPAYCLPKHFVFLDKFPLNQNGKVDKRRLPKPQRTAAVEDLRPAHGDMERAVVECFKKHTGRVHMANECFFGSGGDSVKAMLVVQDLARQGFHLDLKSFFSLRTAEKIALAIKRRNIGSKRADTAGKHSRIVSYDISLSPQQKRLWFLTQMYPARDSYIIRLVVEFKGDLQVRKLLQAFHKVLMANAAMRSVIINDVDEPVLNVLSGTECFHMLSQKGIEDPEICGNSLVVAKLQMQSSGYELDLRIHHIISDGRSLAIVGEELVKAYNGKDLAAKELIPDNLEDCDSMKFWKEYLADYEPCSVVTKGDPDATNGEAGYFEVDLSFLDSIQVQDYFNAHRCTLYHVLVMAYVHTMRMTHDMDDIVIGTTMANRTPENINSVGLYVNTIPLRFSEEFTGLKEQLSYTMDQILRAMEHQTTPLARIIEEIVTDRDVTKTPLFQHVVTFESISLPELPNMEGVVTQCRNPGSRFAQFDQSWIFHPRDRLRLSIQYDMSRYTVRYIEGIVSLFKRSLCSIFTEETLCCVFERPREISYNDTTRNKCLGRIFVEQAMLTPNVFCLESKKEEMHYDQVLDKARNFASKMQSAILEHYGETPRSDDVICIILDESTENHIVIEAVHILGCCYLCISPDTPLDRINFIVMDCSPKLTICDMKSPSTAPVIVPTFEAPVNRKLQHLLRSSHESLAYLIYTSGTTGTPKGVCISHQSVLNMLEHATRKYQFRTGSRVLQFTKSSFDASISNTFGALLNGGALSIRDPEAEVVENLSSRLPISVLHMTPVVADIFDENDLERLKDVEKWSFGGETMSERTLSFMLKRGIRLIQLYGPTEATCYQTLLDMRVGHESTCLGPVISNLPYGLCSFKNHEIQRRDVGQFYCSGENLARGYVGHELGGFAANPFRTKKDEILERNARIYLVGDKLRCDEAGYLHFLGRKDDQIKVKGHRVQLSEIDTSATRQRGVENAVSVIQKDKTGASHIVLYYTGEEKQRSDLETSLSQVLPKYMVPSLIIHLEGLPVTSNGKVDRKTLSRRCDINKCGRTPAKPRNHTEEIVLSCFRRTLKQDYLDINSDFFQSGGHSLLAVRLVDELSKSLNVSVPLLQVFKFPRVRQLAEYASSSRALPEESDSELHIPESKPTPLQTTLLRSFRNPQVRSLYNISLTVTLRKDVHFQTLRKVFNTLAMIHPSLRTRFIKNGRSFVTEVMGGTECYQNLSATIDHDLDPFQKPPFAVTVDKRQVTMKVNHIITDGHSMHLIVDSMLQLLDNKQLRMDDGLLFHSWLLQHFNERRMEETEFWQNKLRNFVYNQLPTTHPRLVKTNPQAAYFDFHLPNLWSIINSWVSIYSCTPFTCFVALFSRVLQALSYDPFVPIPIGFPVNLRTQSLQNSVGYGISTVVVAQDARGNLEKVVKNTMQDVAEAMSHAFLSYDEMIEHSLPKKLFGIMLMLDDYSIYEGEVFKVEPTKASVTKFELSIFTKSQDDNITIEYNKTLYDEDFLNRLAQSMSGVLSNWECVLSPPISRPLKVNGCIYDVSDIQKLLEPFHVKNISTAVSANDEISLICSCDKWKAEDIAKFLRQLPPPLRPKKITIEQDISYVFPLSKQQLQMYFLSLQDPNAYVLPFLKEFPKSLKPTHIHQALLYAIQRQESLRTAFVEVQGEPKQRVLSMTEAYIGLTVLRSSNVEDSVELALTPPLLGKPPVEAVLFENADCFVGLVRLHHIISDAWSTGILERELMENIFKLQRGEAPVIHRQKYTYADYCQKNEPHVNIDEAYVKRLSESEEISLQPHQGGVDVVKFEFPEQIAQQWTSQHGVSLFVIFLNLLAESIMEQFALSSLNIGCPHANRSTKTKSLIGYFLNNVVLVIRKPQNGENPVRTLQEHVNDVIKRNVPFTDLTAYVHKQKRSLKPLFQIYFNCRYDLEYNKEDSDDLLALLPIKTEFPIEVDLDKRSADYQVTFRIQQCIPVSARKELVDRIRVKILGKKSSPLESIPSSAGTEPISDVLGTVLRVAQGALGVSTVDQNDNFFTAGGNSLQAIAFAETLEEELNVEIDIADIYALRSFSELASRMVSVCKPFSKEHTRNSDFTSRRDGQRHDEPPDKRPPTAQKTMRATDLPSVSLVSLLKEVALMHGSKVAFLEPDGSSLTYLEVAASFFPLAHSLRNSFVQTIGVTLTSDTMIPVLGRRSPSTIVECLSVIAAGAGYLPIDIDTPVPRIKTLLKESHAECYVGPALTDVDLTPLKIESSTNQKGDRNFRNCNAPGDLAYVIHTSGTTGTPKGACIKQRAVVNMIMSATHDFRMLPDDVTYQFTNFVYDNSVLEIFMTLSNGARLLVDAAPFSPRRFVRLIKEYSITHCLLFPGVVSTFREENFRKLALLRYWIVGAEKLPQKMLDSAIECGISVIQNYGPTETTAYALTKHMRNADSGANLGKPIYNTEVRVDSNGELLIRGAGIMRGYLNRDTGAVFKVHGKDFWYPSGDHVQPLPNNDIIFVGRKDNQVKIRGHRVGLGDVESTISRLRGIRQCKILWQEEEQALLAFYTMQNGNNVLESAVLEHCSLHLPKHMVPNHVFVLDEFPLTKNTKIDLTKLRANWKLHKEKCTIVEVAENILGRAIKPNLSLFENGGTTQQALTIANTCLTKYGRVVSVPELMRFPLVNLASGPDTRNHDQLKEDGLESEEEVSGRLANIWSKLLKHDSFAPDDNFFFVGGNSLLLLKLRYELNREFRVELGVQDLLNALVFTEMLSVLCRLRRSSKVVTAISDPSDPDYVLIFVHPLYGGSVPYTGLIQSLRELRQHFRILTVQHPNSFGYESSDTRFFESLQSLARSYTDEVRELLLLVFQCIYIEVAGLY
ncbi:hypothetical protein ANCCAN_09751 [Ancylostoma caninum]|uniref:Fatty acid synthase n=1 Tax=Ancylostoma caninum TaxID=29170 RepID=A0A368GIM7_ANCCA|nr:hypothetical protein ANCCAN_09751 [Ancylostoma caninum]